MIYSWLWPIKTKLHCVGSIHSPSPYHDWGLVRGSLARRNEYCGGNGLHLLLHLLLGAASCPETAFPPARAHCCNVAPATRRSVHPGPVLPLSGTPDNEPQTGGGAVSRTPTHRGSVHSRVTWVTNGVSLSPSLPGVFFRISGPLKQLPGLELLCYTPNILTTFCLLFMPVCMFSIPLPSPLNL